MTTIEEALKGIRKDIQGFYYYYYDALTPTYDSDTEKTYYVKVVEQEPCNLDWKVIIKSALEEEGALESVVQNGKIYSNNPIPTGSVVEVYSLENGVKKIIQTFKYSSPSQEYLSHYETVVDIYERFA